MLEYSPVRGKIAIIFVKFTGKNATFTLVQNKKSELHARETNAKIFFFLRGYVGLFDRILYIHYIRNPSYKW